MAQAQSPCLQNGNDWLLLHADRQTVPNHEGSDGDTAQCLGLTLHPIGARRGSGVVSLLSSHSCPFMLVGLGQQEQTWQSEAVSSDQGKGKERGQGKRKGRGQNPPSGLRQREGVYVISKLPPCLPSLGSWKQPLHEASLGLYARHKTAPASVSPLRHCVSFSSFLSSSTGSQGW